MKEYKYMVKFLHNNRFKTCLFDTVEDCIVFASAFGIDIDESQINFDEDDEITLIYDKLTDDEATTIRRLVYVPHKCFERMVCNG